MMFTHVYFIRGTGMRLGDRTLTISEAASRLPLWLVRIRGWLIVRCIWIGSCARLSHVCIGDGEVVLDPKPACNAFWPALAFNEYYPAIIHVVVIPTPVDLSAERFDHRKPMWKSFLRWLTFGHYRCDDCVTCASRLLRNAGVPVPSRIVTPIGLFRWLKQQGFVHVTYAPS